MHAYIVTIILFSFDSACISRTTSNTSCRHATTHEKQVSRFDVLQVQGNFAALDVVAAYIVTFHTLEERSSGVQSGQQHGHNTFAAGGRTDYTLEGG